MQPADGVRFEGKYADGQKAASRQVVVRLRVDGVEILRRGDGGRLERLELWPPDGLEIDDSIRGLIEVRSGKTPLAVLTVTDPGFHKALRQFSGGPLAGARHHRLFVVGGLVAGAAALIALVLVTANPLSQWVAHKIPFEWEEKGKDGLRNLFMERECIEPAGQAALKTLEQRLTAGQTFPVRFDVHVMEESTPNAFAMPGGVIMLTSGLIEKAETSDEVAGVLAHEMTHVIRRHVTAGLVRATLLTAIWQVSLGDYTGILLVDPSTAYEIASLKFNRDAEAEADAGAIELLDAAGIGREGFAAFFERMRADKSEGEATAENLLSTHPADDQRIAMIRKGAPAAVGPALDKLTFRELKGICAQVRETDPEATDTDP